MTCATAYVPQNLVNTLIYSAIVYHMAGLNGQSRTVCRGVYGCVCGRVLTRDDW
jgi:hypothetical protein